MYVRTSLSCSVKLGESSFKDSKKEIFHQEQYIFGKAAYVVNLKLITRQ